jgi:hypothetical protein
MDRYGHLFRSERPNAAVDAISVGTSDRSPERFKNREMVGFHAVDQVIACP